MIGLNYNGKTAKIVPDTRSSYYEFLYNDVPQFSKPKQNRMQLKGAIILIFQLPSQLQISTQLFLDKLDLS